MTGALVAAVALLLVNGFFVAAEFALVAARTSQLEHRVKSGSRSAKAALSSIRHLNQALAGAQLGVTLCSVALGIVAEPAIGEALERLFLGLGLPTGAVRFVSILLALLVVVFFHLVIGEMAPKNLAIAEPEKTAVRIGLVFRGFEVVFKPLIVALNASAAAILSLLGVRPSAERHAATGEELAFLISASQKEGVLEEFEHQLLSGALSFADRTVSEIMVPRTDMVAAPDDSPIAELESLIESSGHSRIPIYHDNLDQVIGFVHAKDLLQLEADARHRQLPPSSIRPIPAVPESLALDPVLVEMRRRRSHLALVVDEHGGTAGLVTMEDVVEELVGEIEDEYDPGRLGITTVPGGYLVPARLRSDELARATGFRFPEGEYETLGGFVIDRLTRLGQPGDVTEHDGWRLLVRTIDGRRIDLVELTRREPPTPES